MNDKFGRGRYREDRYRGDDNYHRSSRENTWRDPEEHSPDQEFETSGNYRQPREPAGGWRTAQQYDQGRDAASRGSSGYGGSRYASSSSDYGSSGYRGGSGYGTSGYRGGSGSSDYRGGAESRLRPDGGSGYDGGRAGSLFTPDDFSEDRFGARSEASRGFSGRGPKGYTRSDDRIREDVCDRLSWNDEVDATDITVRVEKGEVVLEGSVETRHMKRLAEDISEDVQGVIDVHNSIRVRKPILTELKDKLTGDDQDKHYANTGTKTTGAASASGGSTQGARS